MARPIDMNPKKWHALGKYRSLHNTKDSQWLHQKGGLMIRVKEIHTTWPIFFVSKFISPNLK
jgi:hypothetical protein